MENKRKRGRPRLSDAEKSANYTESFYAPVECGERLSRLMASGAFGTTKGAVICAALKNLENNPPVSPASDSE